MRLYQLFQAVLMESVANTNSTSSKPANVIAFQLIAKLFNSSNELPSLQQLCTELKNKKNPNHEKFSIYISTELEKINKQKQKLEKIHEKYQQNASNDECALFEENVQATIFLGKVMEDVGNSEHQIKSVINGIKKYWLSLVSKDKIRQDMNAKSQKHNLMYGIKQLRSRMVRLLTKSYFKFNHYMCQGVIKIILQLMNGFPNSQKLQIRKQLCEQVMDHVQIINEQTSLKCCLSIYYLQLQQIIPQRTIPYIVLSGNILKNYIALAQYPTMTPIHPLIEQLFSKMVSKPTNNSLQDIKKIIALLKLDALNYPSYINQLNKRCLNHFLNNQQIFFTELKVQDRPDILHLLVELLIDRRRYEEAEHFINKFHLKQFYQITGNNKKYMKNILIFRDAFWPTQPLLHQNKKQDLSDEGYLTMKKFGYSIQDVFILDDEVLSKSDHYLSAIKEQAVLGMDTESVPVFNAYEKRQTALLQIATQKKVYIFDILSLKSKKNKKFQEWLLWLINDYIGKIVGVALEGELHELFKEITEKQDNKEFKEALKNGQNMKDIQKEQPKQSSIINEINKSSLQNFEDFKITPQLFDISKFYKVKNPKSKKSSLEHICSQLLQAKLSKYEQCSGWQNRPLRQAQIHYAALDAVLPIVLYQKLRK